MQVNDHMYGRIKAAGGIKRYAKIMDLIGNGGGFGVMSSQKPDMLVNVLQGISDVDDTTFFQ